MDTQTLISIAIGVLVIVWIGGRQLAWRRLTPGSMWTLPLVLTGVGVVMVLTQVSPTAYNALAIGVLAAEVAVSIGLGTIMGRIARFRQTDAGAWETRTGWVGLVLWVVLLGVRIGMDLWAEAAGAGALLVATGTILLVIGINRLTRTAMLGYRLSRHQLIAA